MHLASKDVTRACAFMLTQGTYRICACLLALQGAGPLSDAVLVRELCALRVLRSKRAALERQTSFDTRLQEAHASARDMEL
jgi:hypothetical protein